MDSHDYSHLISLQGDEIVQEGYKIITQWLHTFEAVSHETSVICAVLGAETPGNWAPTALLKTAAHFVWTGIATKIMSGITFAS